METTKISNELQMEVRLEEILKEFKKWLQEQPELSLDSYKEHLADEYFYDCITFGTAFIEKTLILFSEETTRRVKKMLIRECKAYAEENAKFERYTQMVLNIDMVEGFVNFGAMACPAYNRLVPYQTEIMDYVLENGGFVALLGEGHGKEDKEFAYYPEHCIFGDPESEFIPELRKYIGRENVRVYRKNVISGMVNQVLQSDLMKMRNLKTIIVMGVCFDLCDIETILPMLRFLQSINSEARIYVVLNTVDTYDDPMHNHDRQEWFDTAKKMLEQAGVVVVENLEELKEKENERFGNGTAKKLAR